MLIERKKDEIIIRISSLVNIDELQDFIEYVRYKELGTGIEVPQKEIDKLASDLNKEWWKKNRKRFVE